VFESLIRRKEIDFHIKGERIEWKEILPLLRGNPLSALFCPIVIPRGKKGGVNKKKKEIRRLLGETYAFGSGKVRTLKKHLKRKRREKRESGGEKGLFCS